MQQAVRHVQEDIQTDKCGNCGTAFFDFDACCAVKCNRCHLYFCFWCLDGGMEFGPSHTHVQNCKVTIHVVPFHMLLSNSWVLQYNKSGELFATREQTELGRKDRQKRCFTDYLKELQGRDPTLRDRVFDHFSSQFN